MTNDSRETLLLKTSLALFFDNIIFVFPGSVAAISDSAGDTVEQYDYDVYGAVLIVDSAGQVQALSLVGNPYFFTGRRLDNETGLYYYRARHYSPALGRFLQSDPIGYQGGINLYAYCWNNSIIFVDPYGFCGDSYSGMEFIADAADFLYDGIHIGLDIVGTFDPTPISDFFNTAGYFGEWVAGQGHGFDLTISTAAMLPFLGDTGKVLKYSDEAVAVTKKAAKLYKKARTSQKRLRTAAETLENLDSIAKRQAKLRKLGKGKMMEKIVKSERRAQNALDRIKKAKDLPGQGF